MSCINFTLTSSYIINITLYLLTIISVFNTNISLSISLFIPFIINIIAFIMSVNLRNNKIHIALIITNIFNIIYLIIEICIFLSTPNLKAQTIMLSIIWALTVLTLTCTIVIPFNQYEILITRL
ncbi:MAG: hypothetical protein QW478_00775 [Candidatus Micrarchaeaceae archaeon]